MSQKEIELSVDVKFISKGCTNKEEIEVAISKGIHWALDVKRIASPSSVLKVHCTDFSVNEVSSIVRDNMLIAEFMGVQVIDETAIRPNLECFRLSELRYHNSWEWLMPVIQKIQSMTNENNVRYNLILGDTSLLINPQVNPEKYFVRYDRNLLDACKGAIVDFINWYNERSVNKS